jgi:hypothetical protein
MILIAAIKHMAPTNKDTIDTQKMLLIVLQGGDAFAAVHGLMSSNATRGR